MEEIWRDVCGFEGKYQVSNLGRVKSLNYHLTGKEQILRPRENGLGYLSVDLYRCGKSKMYRVHRLVLSTFNPVANMSELLVNHKDENKHNNRLENLEWCNSSYNNTYNDKHKKVGEKLRGRTHSEEHKRKIGKANSIPIVQLDLYTNKVVNVWGSGTAAERKGGFHNGNINSCCKGRLKTHGGYKWCYLYAYISKIDPRIKKIILFDKEYYVN